MKMKAITKKILGTILFVFSPLFVYAQVHSYDDYIKVHLENEETISFLAEDIEAILHNDSTMEILLNDGSTISFEEKNISKVELAFIERKDFKLSLNVQSATINVHGCEVPQATATIGGYKIDDVNTYDMIWSSSDENVAIVTVSGLVYGTGAGVATITAKYTRYGQTAEASMTVKVNQNITPSMSVYEHNTIVGATKELIVLDKNKIIDKSDISWSSSDTNVVTVENGLVTAVGAGTAYISAIVNNKTYKHTFYIEESIPNNEIWYTTLDGPSNKLVLSENSAFNANLIEHVYEKGKWVMRFDADIKSVCLLKTNHYSGRVTELLLPNSTEQISGLSFDNTISRFYIPEKLNYWSCEYLGLHMIDALYGHNISADGRCLVINGTLCWFATTNIEEYVIPDGVTCLKSNLFVPQQMDRRLLKKITIPEGVTEIQSDCFWGLPLESVSLPSSLTNIGGYAFRNKKIKKFEGDCKLISEDGMCLFSSMQGVPMLEAFANGSNLTEYTIPKGIPILQNYVFDNLSLKKLTFPSPMNSYELCFGTEVTSGDAFQGSINIKELYGSCISADHKCIIIDDILCYVASKGLTNYTLPNNVKYIGEGAFINSLDLEVLKMSDNVLGVNGYSNWLTGESMPNLREITISANISDLGYGVFWGCTNLENVYLRAIIPPKIQTSTWDYDKLTKLKIHVPQQSLQVYKNHPDWEMFRDHIVGYEYTDLPEINIDYYISTDYSNDGKVTTIQTATQGNGIDIVLMGDAFSDRQIANGTYKAAMDQAVDALFSEEPYKSHKDFFNVYTVDVVSLTEGYENGGQTFSTWFGGGSSVGGNDSKVFEYAKKAIGEERMNNANIIVMMNQDAYAGTCYTYYPTTTSDYGNGTSVSYFPVSSDEATFTGLVHHEALGHGFAKLDDEYAYEYMGAAPSDYITTRQQDQNNLGWWKNVDFTDDPATVRWSQFLTDERYANDGLGVFEGGSTYWTGVWRPTENSIMRYNTGGFNAPSREAIYYRIHKLAFGDEWQYNYEDFVEYDAINRTPAAEARRKAQMKKQNTKEFRPTAPPVVIPHSWRDAKPSAATRVNLEKK